MSDDINKLSNKNAFLLWVGNWLSNIGNKIFDYANSILILSFGEKATKLMAIYQSSETLISILFNLFGGAMADGNSKKRICVTTDLLAAGICITLFLLFDSPYIGIFVVIANAMLACVSAFNSPTYKAIIREVVKKEKLISFNSIMHGVNESISLIAPLLGLFMVNYIGVSRALLLNGITFGVSACLEMFLKPLPEYEIKNLKRRNLIKEIQNGIKYMLTKKWILFLVSMSAAINFLLSAYNLSMPFSEKIFEKDFYSKMLMAEAFGGIMGSIICLLYKEKNATIKIMTGYLELAGLALLLIPLIASKGDNNYVVLVAVVAFSAFMTVYNVQFFSYVQCNVEQEYLGRIFSIINTVALAFVPLGALFFSAILTFDNLIVYNLVGIGIVIISTSALLVDGILKRWKND